MNGNENQAAAQITDAEISEAMTFMAEAAGAMVVLPITQENLRLAISALHRAIVALFDAEERLDES